MEWPSDSDFIQAWPEGFEPNEKLIRKARLELPKGGRGWIEQKCMATLRGWLRNHLEIPTGNKSDPPVSGFKKDMPEARSLGPFRHGTGGGTRVIRSGKGMT